MDAARFDAWARATVSARSRRGVVAGLLFGPLGASLGARRTSAAPLALAACKPAGRKCEKKTDCCDRICKGKKHKKRCRPRTCQPGETPGLCVGTNVPCTSTAGLPGVCATTVTNQGYCAKSVTCIACAADIDCAKLCGPDAACIDCVRSEAECGGTRTKVCAGPGDCSVP